MENELMTRKSSNSVRRKRSPYLYSESIPEDLKGRFIDESLICPKSSMPAKGSKSFVEKTVRKKTRISSERKSDKQKVSFSSNQNRQQSPKRGTADSFSDDFSSRKTGRDWVIKNKNNQVLVKRKPLKAIINDLRNSEEQREEELAKARRAEMERGSMISEDSDEESRELQEAEIEANHNNSNSASAAEEENDANTSQDEDVDTVLEVKTQSEFTKVTPEPENVRLNAKVDKSKHPTNRTYRNNSEKENERLVELISQENMNARQSMRSDDCIGKQQINGTTAGDEDSETEQYESKRIQNFLKCQKLKRANCSQMKKNFETSLLYNLKTVFLDFCNLLLKNFLILLTLKTDDGKENYWIYLLRRLFSIVFAFAASNITCLDQKVRKCLTKASVDSSSNDRKLTTIHVSRLERHHRHLKRKSPVNCNKKYSSCNTEKVYICKN